MNAARTLAPPESIPQPSAPAAPGPQPVERHAGDAVMVLDSVSVGFESPAGRTEVLADIDLSLGRGELVAVLGFSGSGKSTLVNLLAGLLKPDRGRVLHNGREVRGPSLERAMVFQNYSLLPWLSACANVRLAVDRAHRGCNRVERQRRAMNALAAVRLDEAAAKLPGELSGGMRQRTAVARALAMEPSVLLLDEPLGALDALTRSVVQDEILALWSEHQPATLLITNDVDEALYLADRVLPLSMGPAAGFGPCFTVPAELRRNRAAVESEPELAGMRADLVAWLMAQRRRKQHGDPPVPLPDIEPIDISRHRPSRFLGFRNLRLRERFRRGA